MQSKMTYFYIKLAFIIWFHESPEATVNIVIKACVKLSKLRLSFRIPFLLTSPKRITPRIEYKYNNKNKRLPTLARAGKVTIKVLKTNLKLLALLISLNTLEILNVLIIVVAPPIERLVEKDMPILIKDPRTIIKSKIFHPSLKYDRPKAVILMKASIAKIEVNI